MEFDQFKELLFKKAKNEGFEECEIYFVNRENLSISVYEQEVEKYNLNKTFGLSFRGKINNKMGYSYTEIIDEDAIDMMIKSAKDSAMLIESEDMQFIYDGDSEYAKVNSYSEDLENVDAKELIDIAMNLEKEAKKYSDKVQNIAGCSVAYGKSNYGIYNTKGLALNNRGNLLSAYVVPVIKDNDEKYDGIGYVVANSLNEVDTAKIAKE